MTTPFPRRHSANPSPDPSITGRRVARGREGFAASPLLSPPSSVQSQSPRRAATRDSEVRRRGAADRGLAEPAAVVRGREGYRGSAGGIGVGGALQLRSRASSRMGAGGSSAGADQPSSRGGAGPGSGGGGGRGAARRVAVVAVVAVLALTPLLAFTSVMPPWLHAHGSAQTEGEPSLVTHAALPHTDLHTEVRWTEKRQGDWRKGLQQGRVCGEEESFARAEKGASPDLWQNSSCSHFTSLPQNPPRNSSHWTLHSPLPSPSSLASHLLPVFPYLFQTHTPALSAAAEAAAPVAAPVAEFELPWPEDSMALCLVGQLRTFELTGPSIAANLVGVEGYGQADVFVVAPLDENSAKLLALRGTGGVGGVGGENVPQQGEAETGGEGGGGLGGPRLVSVRVFPDFNINEALYPTHVLKGLENGPQGLLQQFSMEAMCAADIAERERRYSRRYKWLMKARPDSFWAAPPAPLDGLEYQSLTAPPGLDFGGVNDRLAVVPRAAGRAAFARLHMLGAVSEGDGEAGKRVNAETVYAHMLQRLNVSVTRAHFPFHSQAPERVGPSRISLAFPFISPPSQACQRRDGFFRMLALPNLRNRRGGDYCRPCHHEPPPNPFCEQTGPWLADWAALFDQHVPERLAAGRRAVVAAVEGGREGCEAQVAQLSLEVRRRTNPSASLTAPPARPAPITAQHQQASAATPLGHSLWHRLLEQLGGRPVVSGLVQGGKEMETAAAAAEAEEEAAKAAWQEAVRREGWRAPVAAVLCVRHGLGKALVFGASGMGRAGSWCAFHHHLLGLNHSIAVSLPAAPPSTDLLWDAHLLSGLPSMRLLMLPKPPARTADVAAQQQSAAGGREMVAKYEEAFAAAVRRIKAEEEVVGRGAAVASADDMLGAVGASMHVDLIRVSLAWLLLVHTWEEPCAHMGGTMRTHGRDHAHTWEGPCAHMGGTMRTHGRDHAHTWEGPCAHMGGTMCTHGRDHAHTWEEQCAHMGGTMRTHGRNHSHTWEEPCPPYTCKLARIANTAGLRLNSRCGGRRGRAQASILTGATPFGHYCPPLTLLSLHTSQPGGSGAPTRPASTASAQFDHVPAAGGRGGHRGGRGGSAEGVGGMGGMGGRRLQVVGQGVQQGGAEGGQHGVDQGGADASREVEELDAFLQPDDPLLAKWRGEAEMREVQQWLSGRSFHLDRCVSGNEERIGRCTFFSLSHCPAHSLAPQRTTGR
ncbi:unnamed protein product [Closterium sp. Yama58-4]|nr:unnamed protein product [Closterium sp. Yama58-4]